MPLIVGFEGIFGFYNILDSISILPPKVLPQVLLVENTQQRHASLEHQQRLNNGVLTWNTNDGLKNTTFTTHNKNDFNRWIKGIFGFWNILDGISVFLPEVLPQLLWVENTPQRHFKFFAQIEDQQRQKILPEVLPQVLLVENTQQRHSKFFA